MAGMIQRSFAAGEIAPALYGRSDQVKYATGLKICRNFMVQRYGGVMNRPGFNYVCEVKDSSKRVKLLKFVFNNDQTYVLEFGNLYMRVIQDGVLLESGGSPYEIATPYVEADLQDLHYVQSGDIVTIVHPNYQPRELSRTGHTAWTLTAITTTPGIAAPSSVTATAGVAPGTSIAAPTSPSATGTSGGADDDYKICAYDATSISEPVSVTSSGGGATGADPVALSWTASAGADGYAVYKDNGGTFELIGVTSTTSFSDDDSITNANQVDIAPSAATDSTTYNYKVTAVDSDTYEESDVSSVASCDGQTPTTDNPNVISWSAVAGAAEYNVYKGSNGIYGYIGTSANTSFDDNNIEPDLTYTPPVINDLFSSSDNYPSTVTYSQQRRIFANTNNAPERVFMSRTGDYDSFNTHQPLQDDDAIIFTIAGRKVNEVRHLVELENLLVLNSGAEWAIRGDVDGVIRPTAINTKAQSYNGSSNVAPIIIGNTALFVQARGSLVRDLKYSLEEGHSGRDITVFSPHLVDNYTITDWDYQQIPQSIVWSVRSDGTLLGLTYVREHEIWGWHRHDTDGNFENVVSVPEGDEDSVYAVVNRTINGTTKRYIERMYTRKFTDIAIDAIFVDSGLTYDGRNTNTGHTMTLTGGTSWEYDEDLTLTSSTAYFSAAEVGNAIVLKIVDSDGNVTDKVMCTIKSYTSTTVVTVNPSKTVPSGLRSTATSDWDRAVDAVSGLDHLEGKAVSVLADGNVEASGNDSDAPVVTSGAITLSRPYSVIHVGLPIQADIQTLDLDTPDVTITDRRKRVNEITIFVAESRGVFAGPDFDNLTEKRPRSTEVPGEPVDLLTGKFNIGVQSTWDYSGSFVIRQNDPLPLSILSVVPAVDLGG